MRALTLWLVATLSTGAAYAQNIWVDQIPDHRIACIASSVAASDAGAIGQATEALIIAFTQANLVPGPAEPILSGANPPSVTPCLQLGSQPVPQHSSLKVVALPARPAILLLCATPALEECRTDLAPVLGADWKGSLYVVPVFRWVDQSDTPTDPQPTRATLIKTAVSLDDRTTEPDPGSTLKQTNLLLVAPAPDGMAAADLQQKVSLPATSKPGPAATS
jgi:hypothetical protein